MTHRPAARLDDAKRSGVYRACSAADVLAAARGLEVARIDLYGARDKAGLLAAIARALAFPDWFGGNWDALEDCLTDLSWRPGAAHILVFEATEGIAGDDLGVLRDVLSSSAQYWAGRGTPFFAVFVPGPATLPEL